MTHTTEEVVMDCTVTVIRGVDIIYVRVQDHDGEEIMRLATIDPSYREFHRMLRSKGVALKYVPFRYGSHARFNAWFISRVRS